MTIKEIKEYNKLEKQYYKELKSETCEICQYLSNLSSPLQESTRNRGADQVNRPEDIREKRLDSKN